MRTIGPKCSTANPNLKLTRKGGLLIGLAGLLFAGLLAGALWAQQPLSSAVASDDLGAGVYQQIVVQPGDTLWGISSRLAQDAEQSEVLEQILTYNDLETSDLEVGQMLYVPVVE